MNGLRVAVAGGGLGGLCLAQGLLKAGIDVTVYERDAHLAVRRQGYRLHVDGRAGRALEQRLPPESFAVFQATCGDASTRLTVMSERMRVLSEQSSTGSAAEPYAPATFSTSVNRQTLREVLAVWIYEKQMREYGYAAVAASSQAEAETGMRHNRLMFWLYRRMTGTSARVTS